MTGEVFLIPTYLSQDAFDCLPAYILPSIKKCQVVFAENERTTRRYLKKLDSSILIEAFEWHTIHQAEEQVSAIFKSLLSGGKNIAIISEAGCPGVADPGQILVDVAQQLGAHVHPLVGPSSILLSLMASGMNGQRFEFVGYLPIDNQQRIKAIKELEEDSKRKDCTKIFIETPYRNKQLMQSILSCCSKNTKFCIAVNLTATDEFISTKTIAQWIGNLPEIHKVPAIFLLNGR